MSSHVFVYYRAQFCQSFPHKENLHLNFLSRFDIFVIFSYLWEYRKCTCIYIFTVDDFVMSVWEFSLVSDISHCGQHIFMVVIELNRP